MLSVAHKQSGALDSVGIVKPDRISIRDQSQVQSGENWNKQKDFKENSNKAQTMKCIKKINFLSKAERSEKSPTFAVTRFSLSQSLNGDVKPFLTPRQ